MAIHDHINIGDRFNRFVVTSSPFRKPDAFWYVNCLCDCGGERAVKCRSLANGRSGSCGCYNRSIPRPGQPSHRGTYTTEYRVYAGMKSRCHNAAYYPRYGGRGIKVCDRWLQGFEHFLADMGPRPEGKSLDRIDNDGDYTPENCRWATIAEQNSNKRNNRWYDIDGQRRTLSDWARLHGNTYSLAASRIKRGWPPKLAFAVPPELCRTFTIEELKERYG